MHRDYQMIGLCQTALITGPANLLEAQNTGDGQWKFMTIICISPGTLTGVVLQYPHILNNTANPVLAQGDVLYNVKYAVLTSGVYEVIFHKS